MSHTINQNHPSKPSLNTTRATVFYKALSRDTKPTWGNRVVKDFYDLDYEIKSKNFNLEEKFTNKSQERKTKVKQNLKKHKNNKVNRQSNEMMTLSVGKKRSSTKRDVVSTIDNMRTNPETIEIGALINSQKEHYGLCPYQYKNTIQGRIRKKPAYHLSFEKNRVNRSVNLNPIFYNRHKDIAYDYSLVMQDRKVMKQYHSFNSYTTRRVFQPKEELDKIYDTDKARIFATPKQSRQAVRNFDLILQRKQERMKESSLLAYETVEDINHIKQKSISLPMNCQERDIIFYPQVISETRGCYR